MSTYRHNYKKFQDTLLLDEEEQRLRDAGAKTREQVEALWTSRYPNVCAYTRNIVVTELTRRLQ